jgi:hypothetical protein
VSRVRGARRVVEGTLQGREDRGQQGRKPVAAAGPVVDQVLALRGEHRKSVTTWSGLVIVSRSERSRAVSAIVLASLVSLCAPGSE